MKSYRKRFVLFNMAFIGAIMLAAFVAIGTYFGISEYNTLMNTMRQVLEPLSGPTGNFKPLEEREPGLPGERDEVGSGEKDLAPPDDRMELPPEKRDEDARRNDDQQITTVFYDQESGEISFFEGSDTGSSIVPEAVEAAIQAVSISGKLADYDLFYCKNTVGSSVKIAFVPTSYLTGRILVRSLVLLGIYLALMGGLLPVSFELAKLASKPAEDAEKLEKQFIDDVSHDLKTPISVILANSNILKSDPESTVKEQSQWIESTEESARKMLNMVNEMLTLSSSESRKREIEPVPTDLSGAAEKAVLQSESIAFEKSIEINDTIPEDVKGLATDEYAERIFMSLIENALKYEPKGGTIDVELKYNKKVPEFLVRNHGSFIRDEDLPHLFERFYRGDKSRSSGGGYGLGLPIVKSLADSVRATITVTSSEAEGTLFLVRFCGEK